MAVAQSPYRSYQLELTPSENKFYYTDALGAPASGTYVAGDMAVTSPISGGVAPTATTPFLYRCVTGGSPGTWVALDGTPTSVGTQIVSSTAVTITSSVHHITGTSPSISTITVPTGFPSGGTLTLIPDSAITTVTGGNIALGSTGVLDKALIMVWDGTSWFPSYV